MTSGAEARISVAQLEADLRHLVRIAGAIAGSPEGQVRSIMAEALDEVDPVAVEEIKVGYDMLKSLGLRRRGVTVISCPSCARQQFQVIKTVEILEERLAHITTPLTLSVIGCVVNGPGEARETDIGFTGGGNNTHQVYISGVTDHRLKDADIVDHLVELVEKKAAELEAAKADAPALEPAK